MKIRAALAAFALLIAAPAALTAAPLSPTAFRDRLAESMTSATGFPAKPIDERTFVTKNSDGTEVTIFIDNAYQQYLSRPDELDTVIARFTAAFAAKETTAGADQLTVIVRPSDYLTQTLSASASLASFPAPRPLAGDLSTFLAVDSPETVRIANVEDLKRWGLTEEQAWTRAMASIQARVGPVGFAQLEGEPDSSTLRCATGTLRCSGSAGGAETRPSGPDIFASFSAAPCATRLLITAAETEYRIPRQQGRALARPCGVRLFGFPRPCVCAEKRSGRRIKRRACLRR